MRIIGIDPGLNKCGWGIIEQHGSALKHVANGVIKTPAQNILSARLLNIDTELTKVLDLYAPQSAAIEETFVNKSPAGKSILPLIDAPTTYVFQPLYLAQIIVICLHNWCRYS